MTGDAVEAEAGPSPGDRGLSEAVRSFLALPPARRSASRVGKGKLHAVYRLAHQDSRYIIKVKGRETLAVRTANAWKGLRHYLIWGEETRLRCARVEDRWRNELYVTTGWKQLGLPTLTFLPFADPDVRVMRDEGIDTLSDHLRRVDRREALYSITEVAGEMFARHLKIAAGGNPHLFHEEAHTGNILYEPGRVLLFDPEFLPDDTKPDLHHAAWELIALAQSAIRDLKFHRSEEVVQAIARSYPDPAVMSAAARILGQPRPPWLPRRGRRRNPVPSDLLAGWFAGSQNPGPDGALLAGPAPDEST